MPIMVLFSAIFTGSVKIGAMPFNVAAETSACGFRNAFDAVHIQIFHAAAFCTYKMVMWRNISIEVVRTVADPQSLNLSEISQQGKIAIDRAEADIRILLTDI